MRPKPVMCAAVVGACSFGVDADVALVPCARDNTLYQSEEGSISNGMGPYFFAGVTSTGRFRRALLRFDIAAAIPPGSTITGAKLQLNLSRTIAADLNVGLHRALKDWGEGASSTGTAMGGSGTIAAPGDATWLHRFYATASWSTPGGTGEGSSPDYVSAASATIPVGNPVGYYMWGSTPGMAADVQAWLANPSENFGWFVIADETGMATAKRFDSRENEIPANRPVLEVTYTVPCYPNCDGSTAAPTLNVNDFICFNNRYQTADPYCNCDQSTSVPVLNVNDYLCFVNRFAAGCAPR